MQCKNKRLLSLLLVIALFFCGICYEEVPTYSFFACTNATAFAKNTTSEIRSIEQVHFSNDYRCEELVREVFPASLINQAFRRIANKAGRTVSLDLLIVDLIPQYFYLSHNLSTDILSDFVHSHTILINYIHMKDGKKS